MSKKGLEFSFTWLFSIIVGAVILFLAIYLTTQLIGSSKSRTNAELTEQFGILLNPIETSLEDSKYLRIDFPQETRVFNECDDLGNFGKQILSLSVRSGIGREWEDPLTKKTLFDKYVFSSEIEEGDEFFIFVKQFKMPYRIGDMIYLYTEKYCFIDPGTDIEEEIESLRLGNVNLTFNVEECEKNSLTVCFAPPYNCDINVDQSSEIVTKDGKSLKYKDDELLYAAIFSDPNNYECQLKRLMKRAGELAFLYAGKSQLIEFKGCGSVLADELISYASLTKIEDSFDIVKVHSAAESIRRSNDKLSCELF